MSYEGQGRFSEPYVNWVNKDHDLRSVIVSISGRVTVSDFVAKLAELAPDHSWDDILINGSARWERPASEDEAAQRREAERRADERHQQWELQMWETLKAKYGSAER